MGMERVPLQACKKGQWAGLVQRRTERCSNCRGAEGWALASEGGSGEGRDPEEQDELAVLYTRTAQGLRSTARSQEQVSQPLHPSLYAAKPTCKPGPLPIGVAVQRVLNPSLACCPRCAAGAGPQGCQEWSPRAVAADIILPLRPVRQRRAGQQLGEPQSGKRSPHHCPHNPASRYPLLLGIHQHAGLHSSHTHHMPAGGWQSTTAEREPRSTSG